MNVLSCLKELDRFACEFAFVFNAGLGAFMLPEPSLTKVAGGLVAAKSMVGFGLNAANVVNAFRIQPTAELPGSLLELTAEHFWPGNSRALGFATVTDLGTDLGYGFGVRAAISSATGLVHPLGSLGPSLERAFVNDPTELGNTAAVFAGLDVVHNATNVISKVWKRR